MGSGLRALQWTARESVNGTGGRATAATARDESGCGRFGRHGDEGDLDVDDKNRGASGVNSGGGSPGPGGNQRRERATTSLPVGSRGDIRGSLSGESVWPVSERRGS